MAKRKYCPKNEEKLTVDTVNKLSDCTIFQCFIAWRWGSLENVCCPNCQHIGIPYQITSREQLRCKKCRKTFSPTSGTPLAYRKLSLRKLMMSMVLFVNSPKGISSYKLANDVGITQKTAWVLLQKIREAISKRPFEKLITTAHLDCTYLNTSTLINKFVIDENGVGAIKRDYLYEKSCLLVMVTKNKTQRRTYTFVLEGERRAEIEPLVEQYLKKNITVCTDGHASYKFIGKANYKHEVMKHNRGMPKKYKPNQKRVFYHNNLYAEYFFANFKRAISGEWQFLSEKYLALYANEIAFRNDMSNEYRTQVNERVWDLLLQPRSSEFRGYWQRRRSGRIIRAKRLTEQEEMGLAA